MQKLSVIIPTFNEAANIRAALESVRWADELIVVDSFSKDDTVALARPLADRLLQRSYSGPADQKNWAIPQASYSWVLLLDADERVPDALQTEIQALLADSDRIEEDAFWIGRQNHFMGQRIRYSGWQNDGVIRLIRRDRCRYNSKQVHEEIETQGLRIGKLQHSLEHYTYQTLIHYLDKTRRYSIWSAQDYLAATPRVGWYHLLAKPFFRFIKHFVIGRGFLDGKAGFIISAVMAWGVFVRYVKIREIHAQKH